MKICFISDHTYLPDCVGGRESSIHELSLLLCEMGHHVMVVANRGQRRDIPKVIAKRAMWTAPYTVRRVANEKLYSENLLKEHTYDVLVYNVLNPSLYLSNTDTLRSRQAFYFRDQESVLAASNVNFYGAKIISNSRYIADEIQENLKMSANIIFPIIDIKKYQATKTGNFVTFINPVPEKGVDLALQIVEHCPEIEFLFVEGWRLGSSERRKLQKESERLRNLNIVGPTKHMKQIYEETRILLVPSRWNEAFGRVVIEAQASGIPVLASKRGGLPESVEEGGILFENDASSEVWSRKLKELYLNTEIWRALSSAAKSRALRFEQNAPILVQKFVEAIQT